MKNTIALALNDTSVLNYSYIKDIIMFIKNMTCTMTGTDSLLLTMITDQQNNEFLPFDFISVCNLYTEVVL